MIPGFSRIILHSPRQIVFELGGLQRVGEILGSLGIAQGSPIAAIVDPSVKGLEHVGKAIKTVSENYSVSTFDRVEPEPSISAAIDASNYIKEAKPAAVIAIGGGSAIDTAKVAVASYVSGLGVEELIEKRPVISRRILVIAAPTTAGTGSEVTPYAVLTRGEAKVSLASPNLVPDIAMVDPVLTITMPPRLTAGTGLDALSHAIESMISTYSNPLSDSVALLAIELIFRYLRRAYLNGEDLEARYYMSLAATAAGLALASARVVLGHSIAQTFGPAYKIHHGTACGMALPYTMEFYEPVVRGKLALIFDAIARAEGLNTEGLSVEDKSREAIRRTWKLIRDLGIPTSLREIGVSEAELGKLAERTLKEWPRPNSPISLTRERVLEVYRSMYEGRLRIATSP